MTGDEIVRLCIGIPGIAGLIGWFWWLERKAARGHPKARKGGEQDDE